MPVGSLIVKIGADITSMQRDTKRAADSMGTLERGAGSLGFALKALAVGLVARELKQMVSAQMDIIDASAKMAHQIGGTIDGFEGLSLAAGHAGVSSGALQKGIEKLNRKLGEAARTGAGPTARALKELGLEADELTAMDVDVRMAAIADAMQNAGFSTSQMADRLAQLGIKTGQMTRLMMGGGEAIRTARDRVDELGLSISDVDAAKIETANDAMSDAKLAATGLARRLAVEVSPMLTKIANLFTDTTASSKSLAASVRDTAELVAKAAGFMGNALRGVHIVFKTIELAGWAMNTAMVEIFRLGYKLIAGFVDTVIGGPLNALIEGFNKLHGTEITPVELAKDGSFMKALDEASEATRETTVDVASQLKDLATKEWPSGKITKFFAEMRSEAEETAKVLVKARLAVTGEDEEGGVTDKKAAKEDEKRKERFARQLEMLRQFTMSKEELENAAHAKRMEQLNAQLEAGNILQGEFNKLSEGIEKKHMRELVKIRKEGMDKVKDVSTASMAGGVQTLLGMVSSLTAGMARESKTAFDINKAAAIASAVISGAQGVAKTYGAFPFPINIPFAVAHAGLAAAQVGLIAAKQFKGGGSSVAVPPPSVPSSTAGASGPTGAIAGGVTGGQQTQVNVSASGDIFSRQTVLGLLDEINDAVGDGARIRVT